MDIKAQMYGTRYFVDVLSASALCAYGKQLCFSCDSVKKKSHGVSLGRLDCPEPYHSH